MRAVNAIATSREAASDDLGGSSIKNRRPFTASPFREGTTTKAPQLLSHQPVMIKPQPHYKAFDAIEKAPNLVSAASGSSDRGLWGRLVRFLS
jgi:hypothetical protein